MTPLLLAAALPFIISDLNRTWRGEDGVPNWVWYTFMALCAGAVTLDPYFILCWMVFVFGYAVLPWHAMFSAINGQPPGRKDHWSVQWMQDVAYRLTTRQLPFMGYLAEVIYWQRFGVIYGAIRAATILPGVFLLCGYTGSLLPITGLLFLGMGVVYWLCGRVDKAERVMGFAIGVYLIVCAASL